MDREQVKLFLLHLPSLNEVVIASKPPKTDSKPPNSFFLFRMWITSGIPTKGLKQPQVSKIVGGVWKRLDGWFKPHFEKIYTELCIQHEMQFPDYKRRSKKRGAKGDSKAMRRVEGNAKAIRRPSPYSSEFVQGNSRSMGNGRHIWAPVRYQESVEGSAQPSVLSDDIFQEIERVSNWIQECLANHPSQSISKQPGVPEVQRLPAQAAPNSPQFDKSYVDEPLQFQFQQGADQHSQNFGTLSKEPSYTPNTFDSLDAQQESYAQSHLMCQTSEQHPNVQASYDDLATGRMCDPDYLAAFQIQQGEYGDSTFHNLSIDYGFQNAQFPTFNDPQDQQTLPWANEFYDLFSNYEVPGGNQALAAQWENGSPSSNEELPHKSDSPQHGFL